jgi:hypothetical protein
MFIMDSATNTISWDVRFHSQEARRGVKILGNDDDGCVPSCNRCVTTRVLLLAVIPAARYCDSRVEPLPACCLLLARTV